MCGFRQDFAKCFAWKATFLGFGVQQELQPLKVSEMYKSTRIPPKIPHPEAICCSLSLRCPFGHLLTWLGTRDVL